VRQNLLNSFPEKDLKEVIKIEKDFYSFFCDYVIETIKLFSMSEKDIKKRITFGGFEELKKQMGEDKSCIVYLGHCCNWEWISSVPLHVDKKIRCGQIYHPLENKIFDELFLKVRGKFGAANISMNHTIRQIAEWRKEGRQFMIGFIADQTPNWNSIRYWIDFLHQDTPVFLGPERIARQTESVVFYADVKRLKRGYYHCEFALLSAAPQELPENALTDRYFQLLEKTIRENPPYWLWSHNRWKRQRKQSN
jgi:KDO2-lipid IV(A) lauroyltransferase